MAVVSRRAAQPSGATPAMPSTAGRAMSTAARGSFLHSATSSRSWASSLFSSKDSCRDRLRIWFSTVGRRAEPAGVEVSPAALLGAPTRTPGSTAWSVVSGSTIRRSRSICPRPRRASPALHSSTDGHVRASQPVRLQPVPDGEPVGRRLLQPVQLQVGVGLGQGQPHTVSCRRPVPSSAGLPPGPPDPIRPLRPSAAHGRAWPAPPRTFFPGFPRSRRRAAGTASPPPVCLCATVQPVQDDQGIRPAPLDGGSSRNASTAACSSVRPRSKVRSGL